MGEYIYLTKDNGNHVNQEGWARLKELCPHVQIDNIVTSPFDVSLITGGNNKNWRGNSYDCSYKSFNDGGRGGVHLIDTSNSRMCAYLDNFQEISDTTSEHFKDIYLYLDDYGRINGRFGLSIGGSISNNTTNLIYNNINSDYGYSTYDDTESVTNFDYGVGHIAEGSGNAETRIIQNYEEWIPQNFTFICNVPLFINSTDAQNYIATGENSNQINTGASETVTTTPTEYYWEETIYKYDYAYNNKTYIEKIKYYFVGDASDFRICGYIDNTLPTPYNVSFKVSGRGEAKNYYFSTNKNSEGVKRPIVSGVPEKGLRGKTTDDNWIYYSIPHTNINVTGNYTEATQYVNYIIDDVTKPKLPASDLNYKHTGDNTGDQTSEQINKNFAEPVLSSQYICTADQMSQIANVIFTTEETTESALKKGLELYGENPVNDIIDVYHVPFDISGFISNTSNTNIKFGSYVSTAQGKRITAHGNIVTMGSAEISPIYNDFRDWDGTINIDLYLPYLGIVPLDVNCYMNRTLTIKATADTRSHNLRYYLFSDNVLMSYHDTAYGKPITLMGSDVASKFRQNMSANISIGNANEQLRLSNWGSALSLVTSAVSGGVVGGSASLVSGVIQDQSARANIESQKAQNNLNFYHTKSGRTFSGSQACGCSENDLPYCYIIFRIQSTKEPANLLTTYGKPCNIVDKIGNVKGYTQIDNIHLETDAPQYIKQRIINDLQSGVIIN